MHQKKHTKEAKLKISISNTGEKSSQWKGNKAKYQALHTWIRSHYGKASKCINKKCSNKSKEYQWALKKGRRYSRNINDYQEMCRSCHKKMDMTKTTRNKISKTLKNLAKKGKNIKCLVCNTLIYIYPSRVNKKYCSTACRIKGLRNK